MICTQIQLTEEQDEQFERLGAAQRRSKGQLVRNAIDLLLAQSVSGQNRQSNWGRARCRWLR